MSNCVTCQNKDKDNCHQKNYLTKSLFQELKCYCLELNKIYNFRGLLLLNKTPFSSKCSLLLTKSFDNISIHYNLQIFSKNNYFKPFENIGILNGQGFLSSYDNFFIEYRTIDQMLHFYTTTNNEILGNFILKNTNPDNSSPCNCTCKTILGSPDGERINTPLGHPCQGC